MSLCLPPHGNSGSCYGCGKPVRDDKVDPKWYKKPHIDIEFRVKSSDELTSYNLTVHSIECLKKVDWKQVKADILWAEKELMKRETDDIGV